MALYLHSTSSEEKLHAGISVNRLLRTVKVGDRVVKLTFSEFGIFYFLAKNPYKVISRERLLKEIWQENDGKGVEKVAVHMTRLRKKINFDRNRNHLIRTIWGSGYLFDPSQGLA